MRRPIIILTLLILAGIGFGVGHLLRSGEQSVGDRPKIGEATDRYLAAVYANDGGAAWTETAAAARERYKVTAEKVAAYVADAHAELGRDCAIAKDGAFILTEKDGRPAAARRRFTLRCGERLFDVNTEVVAEGDIWRTSFFQYGVKKDEG